MKFLCPLSGIEFTLQIDKAVSFVPQSFNNGTLLGYHTLPVFSLSYRDALRHRRELGAHILLIHSLLHTQLIESFDKPLRHSPESLENPNHWNITVNAMVDAFNSKMNAIHINSKSLPRLRIQDGTNYQTIKDWLYSLEYRLAELQQSDKAAKEQIYLASLKLNKSIEFIKANHEASEEICRRALNKTSDRASLLEFVNMTGKETITQLDQMIIAALNNHDNLRYMICRVLKEEENYKLQQLQSIAGSLIGSDEEREKPRSLAEVLAERKRGN